MADFFTDPENKTTNIDPDKNYLEELVGDGKKFKDNEALAKGKAQSDLHIEHLQTELAELREDLQKRVASEDTLERLKQLGDRLEKQNAENHNSNQSSNPEDNTNSQGEQDQKSITPEELEKLLDDRLNERASQDRLEKNQDLVQTELLKRFGSEEVVRSEISRVSKNLNIKPDDFRRMAQESPMAFLALVGEGKTPPAQPPRSEVNSAGNTAFQPSGPRKQSSWNELRKTNPEVYHSREMVIQRHNDAVALGEAFFD